MRISEPKSFFTPAAAFHTAQKIAPGFFLACMVAFAAAMAEPLIKTLSQGRIALPVMVIALLIGIAAFPLARQPIFEAGISFCIKSLLRIAIALLGLRIALGDIIALGWGVVLLVVISMALTIISALALARIFGQNDGFGALAGAANAVCGASATLAAATIVPDYKTKSADIAFCVIMANAVSTLVMVAYPPLCAALGLSAHETGVMLGLTIHDMAQVVGAGYAVSDPTGNVAVIVKLFRIFLLLPVVMILGAWFMHHGGNTGVTQETQTTQENQEGKTGVAKVPVPIFALMFLVLCVLNSILPATPLAQAYIPIKSFLSHISAWSMLIAIAALGLGTSLGAVLAIGWRHLVVFLGATLVILLVATGGIFFLR